MWYRNHQQNIKVLWKRLSEAKRIYDLRCREEIASNQFYHQEVARCGKNSKEAEKVRTYECHYFSKGHERNDTKEKSRSFVCIFSFPLTLEKKVPFLCENKKRKTVLVNASLDMMTIDKSDNSSKMVTFTGLTKTCRSQYCNWLTFLQKWLFWICHAKKAF